MPPSHIEEVLSSENQAAGRKLGEFYKKNKMTEGGIFDIKIID